MDYDINNFDIINYIFSSFFIIVDTFSIVTSVITVYIVIAKCDYKLPEMIIILILSVIHILSSASELVFYLLKLIFGHGYLSGGTIQCAIFAITVSSTLRFEVFTIGFLAFIRYAIVCHGIRKSSRFWLLFYLIAMLPFYLMYLYSAIILDGTPSTSHLYCSPYIKTSPNLVFLSHLHIIMLVIPCWVCTYCYLIIGVKVYKKLNQMENEAFSSNENDQLLRIQKQKRNLIIQLTVVFLAFNLVYLPGCITLILRYAIGYLRPPLVDAICISLFDVSRAIDPIITIIYQPELNHEFQAITSKSLAKFKSFISNLFK
jgi:hypothetical protein